MKENHYSYVKKRFINPHESFYYNIFKSLENELNIIIQPQVALISIVSRYTYDGQYPKELNRIVDFAVFSRDYSQLILLIEIDDSSHNDPIRRHKDFLLRKICKSASIKLITYYPLKFKGEEYAREYLRRKIIDYYDSNKDLFNVPYSI